MKIKSTAEIGLEKTRNALLVRNRIANALSQERKKMEDEGLHVPPLSISVQGDDRPLWQPEKYFNKNFKSQLAEVKKQFGLSITEIGIIFILSSHISYESNLITNPDGTPVIKKDMEDLLGMGQNAVDKHIALLVRKGVIASVKVKRSVNYYIDPRIA